MRRGEFRRLWSPFPKQFVVTEPLMTIDLGRAVGGTGRTVVRGLSWPIDLGEHPAVASERNRSWVDQLRLRSMQQPREQQTMQRERCRQHLALSSCGSEI